MNAFSALDELDNKKIPAEMAGIMIRKNYCRRRSKLTVKDKRLGALMMQNQWCGLRYSSGLR